ncbi:Long-chain-fatty-acid--CoA ligase [Paraburkholderia sediminicola]|uniref:Long-chain-fatty-acid--CoA ligase n=1 Tax=Paraburkholderia sediminicola TaxID=458836 RepID=A0A6J5CWN9_9BURK|nr:long-chain-fatty-acid--CoA ligase [Paraburkholderia sediminicola]CAB3745574.1 Long-chain-fatty-acid--CoA ligase [Paraburkholderia sediminicola]
MHLAHFVYRSARNHPERPLWITPDVTISYADGVRRINSIAHSLHARLQQRDRVAIISTNRFEAFEVYLAALAAGMTATPLNPKLHVDEISLTLADSGASALVFSPEFANAVETLRASHPEISQWICMERCEGAGFYGDLLEGEGDAPPAVTIDPDDTAWLFYTSGTTGRPKGVMETHRNLVSMVQQLRLGILQDADENDRMIHFAPIAHATASVGLVHLSVGAAQVFPGLSRFDPPKVLEAIERFSATASFMAPTMVQMLLQSPDIGRYSVRSLKNVLCSGAPMYAEVLRRAIEVFGPVFCQSYGQSEAPAQCGMHKSEYNPASPQMLERIGSVGREYPGVIMRIVDEQGNEVGSNVAGEITVRGDVVTPGYWRRREATDEVLKAGWLHTGDVGYRDDHGYIYITDRVKDMIISGGSNIYPREVEEILLQHEAIVEACVVGVPDEVWGEAVKAVVVLRAGPGVTEEDVIEFCRTRLASYKKPKSVDFVDHLPKNAYGKVLKKDVKARYWQTASRAI